jgi:hypothetical protein
VEALHLLVGELHLVMRELCSLESALHIFGGIRPATAVSKHTLDCDCAGESSLKGITALLWECEPGAA